MPSIGRMQESPYAAEKVGEMTFEANAILQLEDIYSRKHYALSFVKVVPREPLRLDLKKSTQQVLSEYEWKASRLMNSSSKIHFERLIILIMTLDYVFFLLFLFRFQQFLPTFSQVATLASFSFIAPLPTPSFLHRITIATLENSKPIYAMSIQCTLTPSYLGLHSFPDLIMFLFLCLE